MSIETAPKTSLWIARIAVGFVFVINMQCALVFLIFPEQYMGAFELSGTEGIVALQGIAIAFLMWNVTYPFVIAHPLKYRLIFIIVLIQQAIGLIGESFIYFSIKGGHPVLSSSILHFIVFDSLGLLIMGLAFIFLLVRTKKMERSFQDS